MYRPIFLNYFQATLLNNINKMDPRLFEVRLNIPHCMGPADVFLLYTQTITNFDNNIKNKNISSKNFLIMYKNEKVQHQV